MEKREGPCTIGGNVNWCSHYGEQRGESSKTNSRFTKDPASPPLGIYPEKTVIPLVTAALCIIAMAWKQPKRPSPEKHK